MGPVVRFAEHSQLQLLLLLLHLVLGFQENFGHSRQRLLHSQLSEVSLFDLISRELFSSATGARIVLIGGPRRFAHPERGAFETVVRGKNDRGSIGALRTVHGVHLGDAGDAFSQDLPRHFDPKIVLVLLSVLSRSEHQGSSIGNQTIEHLHTIPQHTTHRELKSVKEVFKIVEWGLGFFFGRNLKDL